MENDGYLECGDESATFPRISAKRRRLPSQPERPEENSPAFQRWDAMDQTEKSRQGRQICVQVTYTRRRFLPSLSGLGPEPTHRPSLERLGYFRAFFHH